VDLTALLPAGGIAGVLAIVILYLLNSNRQDRAERRKEREEDRVALAAMRAEHGEQLAVLRSRVDHLEKELDDERQQRYAAEASAATERLRAATMEHELSLLRLARSDRHDDRGT